VSSDIGLISKGSKDTGHWNYCRFIYGDLLPLFYHKSEGVPSLKLRVWRAKILSQFV